jgi:hypothetical protein
MAVEVHQRLEMVARLDPLGDDHDAECVPDAITAATMPVPSVYGLIGRDRDARNPSPGLRRTRR